ncbi:MAG: patatin-like phospholipase family protein [Spirochaetia bacterium]
MISRFPTLLIAALNLCAARLSADGTEAARPRPVVAVVLSGGAALGFAHVGVLKVIEEAGIPIDIVVGASMGAIVGGLYAAGYSPSDMARISRGVDWQAAFDDALADSPYSFRERELSRRFPFSLALNSGGLLAGRGLFGAQSITTLLELLTLNVSNIDDFDLLPRRFRAVAADIATGEQVVLKRGSLADAMRASATIPLLFKPYELDGRALVDGGIVNRLPTDIARDMGADIIIAVDVGESRARAAGERLTTVDMLGQISRVLTQQNSAARRALADLVISPDLSGFQRTDFYKAAGIIRRGEEQARRSMTELEAIARRIAATRALEPRGDRVGPYLTSSTPPVAQTLLITGTSAENEQVVRRVFSPLLNVPLSPPRLQAAMNDAYQSGRFEEIRVLVAPRNGASDLVVSTVPVAPAKASALLGLSYQGDLSQTLANSLVITPGIIVRDLSGKGSQLIVDAHLVDTLGAGTEYFQPLGSGLFVDGYADYFFDKDIFLKNDIAQVGRVDRGPTAGAWTGFVLGQTGEVKAGLDWNAEHYIDPEHPVAVDSSASVARFLFAVDTRPARVFPVRGLALALGYDQAFPALGGSEEYKKLSLDAAAAIQLFRGFTLGLTFSGGTDFTLSGASSGALGPADAFSLRTESEFRGFEEWEIRGSHKVAAGLDLQLSLPGLNRVMGTDFYLLGNLSAGNCWTDLPQSSQALSLRYGASLGLGARIQSNFEVAARVCAIDSGRVQISVDVGPFAVDDVAGPLQ